GIEAVDQLVAGAGDFRVGEDLPIDDQVGALVRLLHDERGGATVVAVLRHEALALVVHHDALDQLPWRVDGGGGDHAVHGVGGGPGGDAEGDAGAVVVGVAEGFGGVAQQGQIFPGHLPIHRKPAGGDHQPA